MPMIEDFLAGAVIGAVFAADAPDGPACRYVETLGLRRLDRARDLDDDGDVAARLRRFFGSPESNVEEGIGLALLTIDGTADQVPPDLDVPPSWRLIVFARPYRNIALDRVLVQGIPDGDAELFLAKVGGHLVRVVRTQPPGSPMVAPTVAFPDEHIRFDSPETVAPVVDRAVTATVGVSGVDFHMYWRLRSGSDHLVVFGQSLIEGRAKVELPVFHRWTWAEDLSASVVVLDDPTLRLCDDLDGAWWLGTPQRDYLLDASRVVEKIAGSLGVDRRSVLFYGGSLGGFSSLHMAACIEGARALVDNPQTDLRRYQQRHVADAAAAAAFGVRSVNHVPDALLHRVSVLERFAQQRRVPSFVYMQNLNDEEHVDHHMGRFISELARLQRRAEWARTPYRVETYRQWSVTRGGHFPLGRYETVQAIERVLGE